MKSGSSTSNVSLLRPLLRSLLQKTVRRGYTDLSQKVAFVLASQGDSAWLHARAGVIVFEECWPYAHLLTRGTPSVVTLGEVSSAVKDKSAAGLGSLAHAAGDGDATAIIQACEPLAVKIVAAALKRPKDFFKWAVAECASKEQREIVLAARTYFAQASWPWDKAFMAAGAYLSVRTGVPSVSRSEKLPQAPFPYWTAVDKHTPQGKSALHRVAATLGLSELHLQWASFYFESARTQDMMPSSWWECEADWRFRALGISLEEAKDMWVKVSPNVEFEVQEQSELLRQTIEHVDEKAILRGESFALV